MSVSVQRIKVFLASLGCRLNEAELARWGRDFSDAGHRVVDTATDADVVVLNSCGVTAEAMRKSRKLVRRLQRKNPGAKLVVTGCFSELEPIHAASIAGVDLVLANARKDDLPRLVMERCGVSAVADSSRAIDGDAFGGEPLYRAARTRAFVKVQDGCRNRCSFCIVTVARGDERSRSIDEVVAEVERLHRDGHQEVVLTGVHLGGYGSDLGTELRALVEAVLDRTQIPRLRLSSLEPWDLPGGFFELFSDPRLCPHLHLPLQSGSDRILRLMARRCTADNFRRLVAAARAAAPQLMVTTDVIVGFPQEDERDWDATLALVAEIGFAHVHIFPFSPRPGTAAARLPGPVDEATKRRRSRELHALAAQLKQRCLQAAVGQRRPVLWERVERCDDGAHSYHGLTDNYLRAELTVRQAPWLQDQELSLENRITEAELVDVAGDLLLAQLPAADSRAQSIRPY